MGKLAFRHLIQNSCPSNRKKSTLPNLYMLCIKENINIQNSQEIRDFEIVKSLLQMTFTI